ncbi:unnamed protein product [Owenia fusiformis]|uniref:Uncharacterized protein n=1 Tax=Owenia fusiformis TaxID=6347 RepID=A0A8S4NCI5_OWEFU|nr:unnamed protein product [Owenia fusiformis]
MAPSIHLGMFADVCVRTYGKEEPVTYVIHLSVKMAEFGTQPVASAIVREFGAARIVLLIVLLVIRLSGRVVLSVRRNSHTRARIDGLETNAVQPVIQSA